MKNRHSNPAQGTVEYLVIIGVVVVISLIVVGLATQTFQDPAGSISSTSTKLAQSTSIIRVSEAVVDTDGNGVLVLLNNSGGTFTINRITLGGTDFNYETAISQGGKRPFSIPQVGSLCSCEGFEGKIKNCELSVSGITEYGLSKNYTTNISVDCVSNAVASDSAALVLPVSEEIISLSSDKNITSFSFAVL